MDLDNGPDDKPGSDILANRDTVLADKTYDLTETCPHLRKPGEAIVDILQFGTED